MKVKPIERDNVIVAYAMESPMTGEIYCFYTKESGQETYWNFNGDLEKPTFTPSMLNKNTGEHFIVSEGKVRYLMTRGGNHVMDMIDIK